MQVGSSCHRHDLRNGTRAFSLIELLVCIVIIGLLSSLLLPALFGARSGADNSACRSAQKHIQLAYQQYLDDHGGAFFPWRVNLPEGTLWYWGLESAGGSRIEGERSYDRSRGYLTPYLGANRKIESCPSFPRRSSFYKPKYNLASFGFGLNAHFIRGLPEYDNSPIRAWHQLSAPAYIIAWADSIQINIFQPPATRNNPLYEEWYYLNLRSPGKFHFRHRGRANAAFADGSVRSIEPDRLDPRLDGLSGYMPERDLLPR